MNIDNIKLIVELTKAKVDILRLKSDDYTWQCFINEESKEQLLNILEEIDILLNELKGEN